MSSITGLRCDNLNSVLTSIDDEGNLAFWDALSSSLIHSLVLPSYATKLEISGLSDLLALGLVSGEIMLYDKASFLKVREFSGHSKQITDLTVTDDASWILSTSLDHCLKIWDVISGNLIEWLKFDEVPLSACISAKKEIVAISFAHRQGVQIWHNNYVFSDLPSVEKVTEPLKVRISNGENMRRIRKRGEIYKKEIVLSEVKEINVENGNLHEDLLELAQNMGIKSRVLQNLEIIEEKNAPKILEKEKEKAPFFLFDTSSEENKVNDLLSNYTNFKKTKTRSEHFNYYLGQLVDKFAEGSLKDEDLLTYLKALSPFAIDLEIKSLDDDFEKKCDRSTVFLKWIERQVERSKEFDFVMALLNRFLKAFDWEQREEHEEVLSRINEMLEMKYEKLDEMFRINYSLLSQFGNIQI